MRWEYLVTDYTPHDDEEWDNFIARVQTTLRTRGSEGWELVNSAATHGGEDGEMSCIGFVTFMKKPIEG